MSGKSEEAVVEVCEEEDEKDRVVDFRARVRAANRVCILAPESGVRVVREIDSCDGGDSMVRKKMRERLVVWLVGADYFGSWIQLFPGPYGPL